MKQEGLAFFTDTWMTLIGLLIFFIFFVSMIIKVRRIKDEYYEVMSKMPLEDQGHEQK